MKEPTRPLRDPTVQPDGILLARTIATPRSFKVRARFYVDSTNVIPVVFVPGTMLAPSVALDQAKVVTPTVGAAVAGPDAIAPPAVGMYAVTGAPCPASGWWRSEEVNALDGTWWFAHGSLLPAATFAVPGGSGKPLVAARAIRRRGAWQLVRLAQAPGSGNADDAPSRGAT